MARKVNVQNSNTIQAWMQKINQMQEYLGDIDDLKDSTFSNNDQSAVDALDFMGQLIPKINQQLFNASAPITITANILADSAVFDFMTLKSLLNHDSAMPDSSVHGMYFLGDSPGTAEFDFNGDSISFGNATVTNNLTFDSFGQSVIINKLTVMDSGLIGKITVDSSSTIGFGNVTMIASDGLEVDSALVLNKLNLTNLLCDSVHDTGFNANKASIPNLVLDSGVGTITFSDSSSLVFTGLKSFLLTDSLGYDSVGQGDSGVIYFAAHQLLI